MFLGNQWRKPEIGVLVENVGGPGDVQAKVNVGKNVLHTRFYRIPVNMYNWNNGPASPDNVISSGLIPHLTLRLTQGTFTNPAPWPSVATTANYANLLDTQIFPRYNKVKICIVDNEELAGQHPEGQISEYLRIANTFKPIFQKHNIKMFNGGFGDLWAVSCYAFRWMRDVKGYPPELYNAFRDQAFSTNGHKNAAQNIGSNTNLEAKFQELKLVADDPVWDGINFHMYEPVGPGTADAIAPTVTAASPLVWRFLMEAFSTGHTGIKRPVMVNETGQRKNYQAGLVTTMLDTIWRYGYLFFDWWSGDSESFLEAKALTESTGAIRPGGIAFRDKVDSKYPLIENYNC